jgi:LysM repeat protein
MDVQNHVLNRKYRLPAMILSLMLLLVIPLFVPWSLSAQESVSAGEIAQTAERLLAIVNKTRQQSGLAPMQANPLLMQAAQSHAVDMATYRLFSHTGSDGSSVHMRTSRIGYASRKGVSENWVTTGSADSALAWWMNSYVHRTNVLNPKWAEAGIGVQRDPANGMYIFVLVFGGGNSGENGGASVQVASVSAANAPVSAAPAVVPEPVGKPYVVQPGDTLLSIALRYGLTWQSVATTNGLSENSLLQIGQTIRLPIDSAPITTNSNAIGGPSNTTAGYAVRSGDTLARIAGRYGIPWQELAAANGLGENDILRIGQTLRIPVVPSSGSGEPSVSAATPTGTASQPRFHTVQEGDTVISIALQYDMDWKEVLRRNGLDEQTVLGLGQQIRLD